MCEGSLISCYLKNPDGWIILGFNCPFNSTSGMTSHAVSSSLTSQGVKI